MKATLAIVLTLLITLSAADPFKYLPFFEYCSSLGYPVQDHVIPTDDHYNLRFYRIQAKNTSIVSGKRVVYLQHGLIDSCDTWVVNDQNLSIAFTLANKGFDVWLGNSRGNRYSTKKMSPSVLNFWDFTFHDMAKYDLPAAFTYIKRVTKKQIHYIGHSQGTLTMFIALSVQNKVVIDNLASVHAFAPIAYLNHEESKAMKIIAKSYLANVLWKNHVKKLFQLGPDGMRIQSALCKVTPLICAEILKGISEQNNTVNNMKRIPYIFGHFPSGSSSKNFIAYQQYMQKGQFKNFDYGAKKNEQVYGQKTPPHYDLSKITFPVHLYVGKYDKLGDVPDVKHLDSELVNSVGKTYKLYDYGHATFTWGKSLVHLYDALAFIDAAEPL